MKTKRFSLFYTFTLLPFAFAAVVAAQGAQQPRPGVGPADRPVVDAAAADRGRRVWTVECVTCHGAQARGTDTGANLIRSIVILKDRYGSELGPFLKKGHPTQSGTPSANLTAAQVTDITHFVRQRIEDTLRGARPFTVGDIVTGDAKAGEAYFNGEGKCTTCHSAAANDLKGIATRVPAPVDLQQRMLFPTGRGRGAGAGPNPTAVTVTITPASGPALSGVLVQMDDLHITFRDATNSLRVVRRTPTMKIVKTDPLQAHHELLERITDKNIHDLTAYLVTLK